MILPRIAATVLLLSLAGCSGNNDPRYGGAPPAAEATFGQCAFCHATIAANMLPGAEELRCQTCHADAQPGFVGPGHRTLPGPSLVPSFPGPSHALDQQSSFASCAYCHNNVAVDLTVVQSDLNCRTCHTEAVPGTYGPGHQTLPSASQVPDPPLAAHEPGSEEIFGSCAHCHNGVAIDVLPAADELRCESCHDNASPGEFGPGHRSLPSAGQVPDPPPAAAHQPGPEQSFGSCAYCHNSVAVHVQPVAADLRCETCHDDAGTGQFGPGHRRLPTTDQVPDPPLAAHEPGAEGVFGACAYCHNDAAIDVQPVSSALRCETCHDDNTPGQTGPDHRQLPDSGQVPDPPLATHRPGPEQIFGSCAHCHNDTAIDITPYVAELQCATCHTDAGTGAFGPGHQRLPSAERVPDPPLAAHRPAAESLFASCAFCHNDFAVRMAAVGGELQCTVCHSDGLPGQYGPDHREMPPDELVPAFIGASHAAGEQRRFGSCAYCHADLGGSVLASGDTELACITCHTTALQPTFGPQHRSIPGTDLVPAFVGASHLLGDEARFGNCGFCHNDVTGQALEHTHGTIEIDCARCHDNLQPGAFGPQHQRITPCVDCHGSQRQTHQDPDAGGARECGVCHDPHGSSNLYLVADFVLTPSGSRRPVTFTVLKGLEDGGLASVSQPGSGLCETCHSSTRYFRADGSGEPHFGFPCFTCHPHELGFSPRP